MKINDKVKMNRSFLMLENYLQCGMISLTEAVSYVIKLWREGKMSLDEAEAAIRMLARVKKGA